MAEKFVGMVAVKGVVRYGKRALLMQNAFDHKWQLPGGRMHVDETPEDALVREMKEELGVVVTPTSVLKTDVFENDSFGKCLVIIFLADLTSDPEEMQKNDPEVEDYRWVRAEELDSLDIWPTYVEPIKHALGK